MAKAKGQGSVVQGIMVLVVLLLCTGGLGFAVGYTQQFAPVQKVAPAAADSSSTAGTDVAGTSTVSPQLKKSYWISTKGYERAGYSIKVFLNGVDAGSFQTPDRIVDVTKFVHTGDNKVRFLAKALPAGNRTTEYASAYLNVSIYQGEKFSSNGFKNGEKLVEYSRTITETQDFDDTQDFTIVE